MKPYLYFIFKDRFNKRWLIIAVMAMIAQFLVFKQLYPFASYFTDSYTYISAAANHEAISYRPIGYSRFLVFVHAISTSEKMLVGIQYLLMQLGALHLFFSLLYFYRPGRRVRFGLFVVLLFNPVVLYLSNYVSSDALFTGLSLFWFTGLLWIVNRPRGWQLLLQALWLVLIIHTRFTALYYPLPALFALALAKQKWIYKTAGVVLLTAVTVCCIIRIQKATESVTGTRVFSAFSGWQMANNALHVYCHVEQDSSGLPPACRELAGFVRTYFDTSCPRLKDMPPYVTTNYMWLEDLPLKKYMEYHRRHYHLRDYFDAWNAVGPIYSSYGVWLIKKHPLAFGKYYLWPSSKTYLLPPLEVMQSYNCGTATVDKIALSWFKYPVRQVSCVSPGLQQWVLGAFPVLFLTGNLLFVAFLLWFLLVKGFSRAAPGFSAALSLVAFFLIINAGFSIIASPSSLRYELFSMILLAVFSLLLPGWLKVNRLRP